MAGPLWRYDPLDLARFPVGEGPFRARGLAFVNALKYVELKYPGGLAAFRAALGPNDPYAAYYDQIFVVAGDYDVSPLLHLFAALARMESVPVSQFIVDRARWSGGSDSKGVWKPALRGNSVADVAGKLHFAFERYFPPSRAEPRATSANRFEGELSNVPTNMDGLYAQSTIGFYEGALEGAGAKKIRVQFERPVPDGQHLGTPVERIRFAVTWET